MADALRQPELPGTECTHPKGWVPGIAAPGWRQPVGTLTVATLTRVCPICRKDLNADG